MHTYTETSIHAHINKHTHMFTHTQKQACPHAHKHKEAYTHTNTKTSIHACTHMYKHICIYTESMHTHIHNTFTGKQAYINVHRPHNKVILLNTIAVVWT